MVRSIQPQGSWLKLYKVRAQGEAWNAVVSGHLARQEFDVAAELLDEWQAVDAASPVLLHLRAVHANLTGDGNKAEAQWIDLIDQQPEFELAWLGLSSFYKRPPEVRFAKAEIVLAEAVQRFPYNADAQVELAEVRRRLGIAGDGSQLNDLATSSQSLLLEQSALQFDRGEYQQALAALEQAALSGPDPWRQMTDSGFQAGLGWCRATRGRIVAICHSPRQDFRLQWSSWHGPRNLWRGRRPPRPTAAPAGSEHSQIHRYATGSRR